MPFFMTLITLMNLWTTVKKTTKKLRLDLEFSSKFLTSSIYPNVIFTSTFNFSIVWPAMTKKGNKCLQRDMLVKAILYVKPVFTICLKELYTTSGKHPRPLDPHINWGKICRKTINPFNPSSRSGRYAIDVIQTGKWFTTWENIEMLNRSWWRQLLMCRKGRESRPA